jgi:hypothetical protein
MSRPLQRKLTPLRSMYNTHDDVRGGVACQGTAKTPRAGRCLIHICILLEYSPDYRIAMMRI